MAKVVKRTFSLTEEQAAFIDRKVESGGYASGSEVVRESLRGFQEEDARLERWLREEVLPTLDRVHRGKEKLLSRDEVRKQLEADYRRLLKAAE